MVHAVVMRRTGGPEVLEWTETEVPAPGPGEVRIRQTAIGLNYMDTYFRSGLYPTPGGFPFIPGGEGAGVIVALGAGVEGVGIGDRVAYVGRTGAYATERLMPADRLVPIPEGIDDRQAAAVLLAGMTVWYLLRRTFRVDPEHRVLFHAAAGKVGLIAGQWLRHLGATSIGTAGSEAKIELARTHGYDHVVNYREADFVAAVRGITNGRLCDVVYDSVGRDTFPASLDCIRPTGMWVTFGQSSGPLPPLDTGLLARKGSLFATRPILFDYIAERRELLEAARELFDLVAAGVIAVPVRQTFALEQAREAHAALEGRATTGASVLIP